MIFNIEDLREYCLAKKGTNESFPFDESTLVFKLINKVFAITSLNSDVLSVNLKCDPEIAIQLRNAYPENVHPGYHMNKKHWNTVIINNAIHPKIVMKMIDDSYALIFTKLKKADRESLLNL